MKKNITLIFDSDLANRLNTVGITLYPNIYFSFPFACVGSERYLVKHELIHVEQIERSNVFKFYSLYVLEWLGNIFLGKEDGDSAYYSLQDETEARARQWEPFTVRDYEILHGNGITEFD
jgi:hypothetical protein